jgi:hypothetical protein
MTELQSARWIRLPHFSSISAGVDRRHDRPIMKCRLTYYRMLIENILWGLGFDGIKPPVIRCFDPAPIPFVKAVLFSAWVIVPAYNLVMGACGAAVLAVVNSTFP